MNLTVPLVTPIVDRIQINYCIFIRGVTTAYSNTFSINLQCGPNVSPRDDVALHLRADFIRNVLIRNSIQRNVWGMEESNGSMTISRGNPFEIEIMCEMDKFQIKVNKTAVFHFVYRMDYLRISHIAIDGEVSIMEVKCIPPYPSNWNQPGVNHVPSMAPYSQQPRYVAPYPQQPGYAAPYPQQPGYAAPFPQQPGHAAYPQQPGYIPHSHHGKSHKHNVFGSNVHGMHAGAGYATGHHHFNPKKAAKKQKKANKKALKYGIPVAGIAGAGLGAYALHQGLHHSSSSSSSSSSSEEE